MTRVMVKSRINIFLYELISDKQYEVDKTVELYLTEQVSVVLNLSTNLDSSLYVYVFALGPTLVWIRS